MKVQPQEPLVLKGVENTDWHLLRGDTDVRVEVRCWAGSLTPTSALQGPLSGAVGQTAAPDGVGWIEAEDPFNTKSLGSPQWGRGADWEDLGPTRGIKGSQPDGHSCV